MVFSGEETEFSWFAMPGWKAPSLMQPGGIGKVATPGAFLFDSSMGPLFQALFPAVE